MLLDLEQFAQTLFAETLVEMFALRLTSTENPGLRGGGSDALRALFTPGGDEYSCSSCWYTGKESCSTTTYDTKPVLGNQKTLQLSGTGQQSVIVKK